MLAKIDYVTDPEDRTLRWHYERTDREYSKVISLSAFESWSRDDGWVSGRSDYYRAIEDRIITERLDRMLQHRFKEIDDIAEDLKYMHEWVTPLRDQNGYVRRYPLWTTVGDPKKGELKTEMHPFAGLPMYALPFKSMEGLVDAFLKLDERLMLKRGDATSRTEDLSAAKAGNRPSVLDPKTIITQVSKEERAAMAKALLLKRQPELLSQPVIDVEVLAERGSGETDGNTI